MTMYFKAFIYSVLVHAIIAIFLLFTPVKQSTQYAVNNTPNQTDVLKTISVDAVKVQAEINRIQEEKRQKKRAEIAHQKQLQKQAYRLKQERIAEQKRLHALEAKANALREANIQKAKEQAALLKAEQAKILALKKERLREQRRIKKEQVALKALKEKKLKAQKDKAQKRKAALAKAKKEKEAKRKAEIAKLQNEKDAKARLQKQKADMAAEAQREAEAQKIAGLVDRYKGLIINAISQHWIVPPETNKDLSCRFEIHLSDNGTVLSVKLLRSSGYPVLDRSAQTAIFKASPLPVPKSPDAFQLFKVLSLTVKPEALLNARNT